MFCNCNCNGTGIRDNKKDEIIAVCECSWVATPFQTARNRSLLFVSIAPGSIIQTIQDLISSFVSRANYRNPYDFEEMFSSYGNLEQIKKYIKFISMCMHTGPTPEKKRLPYGMMMAKQKVELPPKKVIDPNGKEIFMFAKHAKYVSLQETKIIQNIITSDLVDVALRNGHMHIVKWCMLYDIYPNFNHLYAFLSMKVMIEDYNNRVIENNIALQNETSPGIIEPFNIRSVDRHFISRWERGETQTLLNPKQITFDDILNEPKLQKMKGRCGRSLLLYSCQSSYRELVTLRLIESNKFTYGIEQTRYRHQRTVLQTAIYYSSSNVVNAIINASQEEINQKIYVKSCISCKDILTLACTVFNEKLALKIITHPHFNPEAYLNPVELRHTIYIIKMYIFIYEMKDLDLKLIEFYSNSPNFRSDYYESVFELSSVSEHAIPLRTEQEFDYECLQLLNKDDLLSILLRFKLIQTKNKNDYINRIKLYIENRTQQAVLNYNVTDSDDQSDSMEITCDDPDYKFTPESLSKKTNIKLKNILRSKQLKVGGKKQVLIDRIIESQINI
ncbi:MAG: SAP domain-containing protein [Colwellia sp.]|nr:SAP domain-containing protein [Colwellia sp.]